MMTKWKLALQRVTRRMWFRATLYCLLGIATALAGAFLKFLIPEGLAARIGADSVGNILAILAASMLTVTTFALSTMVSAYSSASNSATPRAARLLIEDSRTQGALATFIGAFLFSIVGLIALSTGLYGDSGRLVLFGATIAVIAVITVTLLRAIEQLSRFGRLGETIELVEHATLRAMQQRARDPLLGCRACADTLPEDLARLVAGDVGHVEHIDTARLQDLAEAHDLQIHVLCQPGTFATAARPLLGVEGQADETVQADLLECFTLGDGRRIENDPRFGLVVLSEIALRSLSRAVNDPGTCIEVLGRGVRLLTGWSHALQGAPEPDVRFARVHLAALRVEDFFEDFFAPIARDSGSTVEIHIKLQKGYAALGRAPSAALRRAALAYARQALARAMAQVSFEADREAIRTVAAQENGIDVERTCADPGPSSVRPASPA